MLNLLPPELKEQRRTKSMLYSTAVIYVLIAVVVGLIVAGLATWGFVQQSEISSLQTEIQGLSNQRKAKESIISTASFIEDRLKAAPTLQEKRKWELILDEIARATPTDIILTSIRVATSQADQSIDISVSGTTTDRRSIVLFRDKLESASTVTKTTILSLSDASTETKKEYSFSLSATYTETKETD